MTPDRRSLLKALALAPATLPLALKLQAQEAGLVSSDVCLVQPELTEGPFYLNPELLRQDITEGRDGRGMNLALQVVDSQCRPVEGARVDLWHCDAQGRYSGYSREGTAGETFLRGTQVTGARGIARFLTVFPGWYRGRTPHIHYKVYLDDRSALTSQLFFDDAAAEAIYGHPAYARDARQSVFNGNDGIYRRAGERAVARLREVEGELQAALVVGIDAA